MSTTIDKKNKIIGISAISAIAVVLIAVIVFVTVLSSRATNSSTGNLMQGYKINRKTADITENNAKDYTNFCTKILTQQAKNGGNTAISLPDVANTLSFIASTSFSNTRKQIENVLGQSAEDTAAMIASLEKTSSFKANKKYGIMSSNTAWFNTTQLVTIKKSFLKTNAKRYGIAINRESFDEPSTSTLARETVVDATDGNSYYDVLFSNEDNFNIVSGASFKSLWVNGANTDDTYDSLFAGENSDYNATYFKTVESKYLSGETFVGTTKEYTDGFTFVGIVPREIENDNYYTLQDVANEFDNNKLLENLLNYTTNAKVEVTLPYYANSVNNPTCIDFSKTLKALGVTSVFGNSAALTELADNSGSLHLDNYYISGDISITPAGAINNYSNVKINKKDFEDCKVSVTFNRSFIYFIYDNKTQLPVYFGIVNAIL